MSAHADVLAVLYDAIEATNESLAPAARVARESHTVLLGPGGKWDSLAFVTFVVAVEEALDRRLGWSANVMDIVTSSGRVHWTVDDMVEHLATGLASEGH